MTQSEIERNKATAHRYLEELWNRKNLDIINEVIAPDFVGHLASPSRGTEGVRQNVTAFHLAFPDSHLEIHDIFAEADRVAIRWTTTGTHNGPFFGIEPTGKKIVLKGITIERFRDGKMVELWAEMDIYGLIKQLKAD